MIIPPNIPPNIAHRASGSCCIGSTSARATRRGATWAAHLSALGVPHLRRADALEWVTPDPHVATLSEVLERLDVLKARYQHGLTATKDSIAGVGGVPPLISDYAHLQLRRSQDGHGYNSRYAAG